ncbi:MAG: haloacid dehalogenase-like hydrolase, partial [Bacteroidota bacterium]|nr:haloacid dehalogenase-like hydrolase [Bacteroidota bacterium]
MKYGIWLLAILVIACQPSPKKLEKVLADPLPSWVDGPTKDSILQFVEQVVMENGPNHVEVKDRIAVFDNDGNLWSEKPGYFQLLFAFDRLHEMYPDHPEWDTIRAFRLA